VIERKLQLESKQQLFFTSIAYDEFIFSEEKQLLVSEIKNSEKVLLAGIAKPEPFFDYLKNENDTILTYPDHHHFSEKDILEIKEKAKGKIIITTEKDFVRLKGNIPSEQLFYLPIKSEFLQNQEIFNQTILSYVENNS